MSDIDGPVCLTRSAPDQSCAGQLFLFDAIPSGVVSRSGVLSSIAEASGSESVRLPDFVTLAEFKIWSSTIRNAEIISDCKDMAHACTVLKAADALDDHCFCDWLDVTVGIFLEQALAHHHRGGRELPEEISAGFSKLPDHLQQRVIEAMTLKNTVQFRYFHDHCSDILLEDDRDILAVLLDLLPAHHHAATVSMKITGRPDTSLSVGETTQTLPFLRALGSLPKSRPPLLSLILSLDNCPTRNTMSREYILERATSRHEKATALASALRHHSGLSSLTLMPFCDHVSMQAVAPAIATLTALKALHLGAEDISWIPRKALPLLKAALQPLSRLQEFSMSIALPSTEVRGPCLSGSADGSTSEEAPHHCLAEMLSTVTALTSLKVVDRSKDRFCIVAQPLSLPCLKQLRVQSAFHDISIAFLNQLTAPLDALSISCCHHDFQPEKWSRHRLPLAQQLWSGLQRFVHLRSLNIELGMCSEYATAEAHLTDELLAGAPAALACLSCLQELRFEGELPAAVRVMRQLAASEAELQRLMVYCRYSPRHDTAEAFQELLSSLSSLPLQHLHLSFDCMIACPTLPGIAALQPLTQLTRLCIKKWESCLRRPRDCEALAGMQRLQSLYIHGFSVPLALQTDSVRCLGVLPALTELKLQPNDFSDGFQAAFVQSAPGAEWAALEWLEMCAAKDQAEAIARAVAAFPAVKELMLWSDEHDFCPFDEYDGDRDVTVPTPLWLRVQRIAAEVGLKVGYNEFSSRFHWRSAWA